MKWKEITIYTTEEGTEIILARLDMLGITQVNIVQGDEEIDALLHSCEKYWDYADEAAMGAFRTGLCFRCSRECRSGAGGAKFDCGIGQYAQRNRH